MASRDLDKIGYWSEVKLEIVKKYASAYSAILAKKDFIRGHVYIDAFAGAGVHLSKTTGKPVPGSPLNALQVTPPFSEYHFIDLDGHRTAKLRSLAGDRGDVHVHEGDGNRILLEQVLPRCRFESFRRALCLLDPYDLGVDWSVLQMAGAMKSVEIFFNFMIMDANMNVLHRNPDRATPEQRARLDATWGPAPPHWHDVSYTASEGLFGQVSDKNDNQVIAEALRERLETVAGFQFVPEPLPMRNTKGAVIYYLYFAGPDKTGAKIIKEIFDSYRGRSG